MHRPIPAWFAALLSFHGSALAGETPRAAGYAASDHADASDCGAQVLSWGGNAADAAVAMALCAGVAQPAGSGLGGGGFAVVRTAEGSLFTLDFRETAPAAAHRDLFLDASGSVRPGASNVGGLAVAIPSESRGLATLWSRFGSLPAKRVATPAILLARKGFRAGAHLVAALDRESSEDVHAMLDPSETLDHGTWVRRPALGKTLARWARTAGEDLHTGWGAAEIVARVAAADGILTAADLATYQPVERPAVLGTFRDHTLVSMGPPSSGGILLAQMLAVLDEDPLPVEGRGSADAWHRMIEAMAHAFADRTRLGDPAGSSAAPEELLSPERVAAIRADFDPAQSFGPEHYVEGAVAPPPEDHGTQHLSAASADGSVVALTTTINTSFGSGVTVPALGIVLNDEMDDFAAAPGVPNAYGLVQGEANAVHPGHRPLSSMTPTLVLDGEGQPVMVVGASGGSTIITAVFQVIVDVLAYGVDPDDAVAAPRVHHQWRPDRVWVEPGMSPDTRALLEAKGHTLVVRPAFSAVQVLVRGEDGLWTGASDPRKGGRAAPAP